MDVFMQAAIDEALDGESEGGQAIGSVLIRNGEIIGRGRNRLFQTGDPTSHAEMEAIRDAGIQPGYADTILYTTMLPCFMCAGTIVQLGIPKVIVGNSSTGSQSQAFMRSHAVEVLEWEMPACKEIIAESVKKYPDRYGPTAGRGK